MVFRLAIFILALATQASASVPYLTHVDYVTDPQDRVSSDFKVPRNLEKRVGFWFEIYTQFTTSEHVLHHSGFPWIVFDVVDTRPILESPGHRWTKFHKSIRAVQVRKRQIVSNILRLSQRLRPSQVTPELLRLRAILSEIPGAPRQVARRAALKIRSQLGQKDFFISGLINASRYIPAMEDTFRARRLPTELTRLPLVESSFNEEAVSKAGASGIWQLMPAMGNLFLKMVGVLDERNSPLKATSAAALILKENYKNLKTWPLAVTAYNHGPVGLRKAAHALNTKDLAVLILKYRGRAFGFATTNFFSEFLAALHAEKYQKEIFGSLPKNPPVQISSLVLPRAYRIQSLTKMLKISFYDLQAYNPELRDEGVRFHTTLPRGYKIFVPSGYPARLKRDNPNQVVSWSTTEL